MLHPTFPTNLRDQCSADRVLTLPSRGFQVPLFTILALRTYWYLPKHWASLTPQPQARNPLMAAPNTGLTALRRRASSESGVKEYHKVIPHHKLHTRDSSGETQRRWLPLLGGEAAESWAGDRLIQVSWEAEFFRIEIFRVQISGISSLDFGTSPGIGGILRSGIDILLCSGICEFCVGFQSEWVRELVQTFNPTWNLSDLCVSSQARSPQRLMAP